ncbi:ParB N-terminal domain-containing protein [Nannocystaceae bacterium ST9]
MATSKKTTTKKATAKKTSKAEGEGKKKAAKKTTRRKQAEAGSRGLTPSEMLEGELPEEVGDLGKAVVDDGGVVLATYRDPLGGHWQLLVSIPIESLIASPFQRDLSTTHAKRMTEVIDKLGRFLDPVIAVRSDEGQYWTPNGLHRLTAMKALGAKSIVALLVPDFAVVYKILALNTEKAHNLKEKALEVIRMARSLAQLASHTPETDYSLEFEEPALLTIGVCYEKRPRFSGGAYNPILRKCESFASTPLSESIGVREARADKVLALDDLVGEHVKALKARGFDSPYIKTFVVARINPLKGKDAPTDIDVVLDQMLDKGKKFDASKIREDEITASSGGPPPGDESDD